MLLIDAGNTRIKLGRLLRKGHRREAGALAIPHGELDLLPAWLETLTPQPERAVGVSVAGAAMAARIEGMIQQVCGISVRWMSSTPSAAGLVNLYEEPAQLGADRWVSLIGLASHTSSAALLATFGTATTVDVLGPCLTGTTQEPGGGQAGGGRHFEGGIILPGPELMRQSLAKGTAGLPYAQGASVPLPRNTHAAISSGIAAAQAGAVLRQWQAAADTLGLVPQLYCAGGGWPMVSTEVQVALARAQAQLGVPCAAPQWLDAPVLDGLAVLA